MDEKPGCAEKVVPASHRCLVITDPDMKIDSEGVISKTPMRVSRFSTAGFSLGLGLFGPIDSFDKRHHKLS